MHGCGGTAGPRRSAASRTIMFEVKNISRRFGRRTVLDGVSFDVAPGEVVGVLGANGAGKTTLLRVLSAYLEPASGEVLYDGVDVFADRVAFRRLLGYLPERCPLYDEMRVDAYLTFRGLLRGLTRHRTARRIRDVAAACGIQGVLRQPIAALSGGFRRRVGLAEALLALPKVLLLDDPFAGLDPAHGYALRQVVAAASVRAAVIVSGHDVAGLAEVCTRFLVLRGGRTVYARRVTESDPAALVRTLTRVVSGLDPADGPAEPGGGQ